MRDRGRDGRIVRVYLLLEVAFLCFDVVCKPFGLGFIVNCARYLSVLAGEIVASYFFCRRRKAERCGNEDFIALGLGVTALADLFLTLVGTPSCYTPGIALFCVVQMLYYRYLGPSAVGTAVRLGLFAATVAVLVMLRLAQVETVLGALDLVLLLANVAQAWMTNTGRRDGPMPLLFKLGITLFFCCDVSLGVQYLGPVAAEPVAAFMVWNFYLPSQVLITLSYAYSFPSRKSVTSARCHVQTAARSSTGTRTV